MQSDVGLAGENGSGLSSGLRVQSGKGTKAPAEFARFTPTCRKIAKSGGMGDRSYVKSPFAKRGAEFPPGGSSLFSADEF